MRILTLRHIHVGSFVFIRKYVCGKWGIILQDDLPMLCDILRDYCRSYRNYSAVRSKFSQCIRCKGISCEIQAKSLSSLAADCVDALRALAADD